MRYLERARAVSGNFCEEEMPVVMEITDRSAQASHGHRCDATISGIARAASSLFTVT